MTTPADPPTDLTAWLRWVFDQREAEARLLCALANVTGTYLRDLLAEVDAKRRILDEHRLSGQECRTCSGEPYMEETWDGEEERVTWKMVALTWPCPTVRLLALPYADRPGYRDEWRPE